MGSDVWTVAEPELGYVLVVDDDPGIRRAFERLGAERLRITTCATAEEALHRLGERLVDVVVTELDLPGMSGLELCAELCRQDPDVPVVLHTGNPGGGSGHEGPPPFAVLEKPTPVSSWVETVERALRYRQARATAIAPAARSFVHAVAHAMRHRARVVAVVGDLVGTAETLEEARALGPELEEEAVRIDATLEHLLLLTHNGGRPPRDLLDTGRVVASARSRLTLPLEVELPAEWPKAVGYEPWVEEVWFNLLDNAARHGGASPRARIEARTTDGWARFALIDNGPGLHGRDQLRAFGPFVRLSAAKAGDGLGLAVVRRLVERMGGGVRVSSNREAGARFEFMLPGDSAVQSPAHFVEHR